MHDGVSARRMWRRLILISGHRRGGTTWINAVLGRAAEASYMRYEAFMVRRHPRSPVAESVQAWRRYPHWHVDWATYGPLREDHAQALRDHLDFLVEHYFGGPVDTLLVKDPFPGRLPFLLPALQPDAVVYVRRHPLGIVNSYDKSNLYSRWDLKRDWTWFLQDLPGLMPEWLPVAREVRRKPHVRWPPMRKPASSRGRFSAGSSSGLAGVGMKRYGPVLPRLLSRPRKRSWTPSSA